MSSCIDRDLVFLILQFLEEEKYEKTLHILERESGLFFNLKYFEEQVHNGNLDEADKYLSSFTKLYDNQYSTKMFFYIRKLKYLEALDKHDQNKAVEILSRDLEVFSSLYTELFEEMKKLLTLDNIREHEIMNRYSDTKTERAALVAILKGLLQENPLFHDKLQFPVINNSRLRTMINQSLTWQHGVCRRDPRIRPEFKTLFVDHCCQRDEMEVDLTLLLGSVPKAGSSRPRPPFVQGSAPKQIRTTLAGRMPNPSSVTHPTVPGVPIGLGAPLVPAVLTYPRIPLANSPVANPCGVSNQLIKSTTPISLSKKPIQAAPTPIPTTLAGCMQNPSSVTHPTVSSVPIGLGAPPVPAVLTHPRIPPSNPSGVYNKIIKSTTPITLTKGIKVMVNADHPKFDVPDCLPTTLVKSLNQGSSSTSMDFHPQKQTLLLVGTTVGDIALWEVISGERLAPKSFKVWNLSACSLSLQSCLVKDPHVKVNRVIWSPDGSLFGVAYSRHIVQIYSYNGNDDVGQHLEIDAHVGGVNDIAFSHPHKQLYLIPAGDDKTVKVWDAITGTRQYVFEGHEAPVYCVCPQTKQDIPFILSTGLDGTIKVWVYDHKESKVNYYSPGRGLSKFATTVAYSSDGRRLFSCGTRDSGEVVTVELDDSRGAVKTIYEGFKISSPGVVQFDIAQNKFLAAGDDFCIRFWDMDYTEELKYIVCGGFPARPRIRFNKDGYLLAASDNENRIKIFANMDGILLLKTFENLTYDAPRSEAANKATVDPISAAGSSRAGLADRNGDKNTKELCDKSKIWTVMEINKPSQCRSLILPENVGVAKISRLIYTNSGSALLALCANAILLLWKWKQSDHNSIGKATASDSPQLGLPESGILMANDVTDSGHEEAIHCFALSKNDGYIVSASGGKISIFNTITFEVMTTFKDPPPAATFLAFYPDNNNIIAIGMDDSTIHICKPSLKKVITELKGHSRRITGLAFSKVLNVLVSSGADAQLCVWSSKKGWEKQNSRFLQLPVSRVPSQQSDTHVQFHQDQIQFLVVRETQLAIFEAKKLESLKRWLPGDSAAPIFHGTFSCDSQLVYASFLDGSVRVFTADHLCMQCRISPSAYLPKSLSTNIHQRQLVIAAHPQQPNQFAIGLPEGAVYVIEPLESEGKWGIPPPL